LFPGLKTEIVQNILSIPNLKGVVLETYGSGNGPTSPAFINLLAQTIKNGIKVVNVTQCQGGSIIEGHYETSVALCKIGVINGKDITTEAAIAKLMHLLTKNISKKVFKELFEKSMRGEITAE